MVCTFPLKRFQTFCMYFPLLLYSRGRLCRPARRTRVCDRPRVAGAAARFPVSRLPPHGLIPPISVRVCRRLSQQCFNLLSGGSSFTHICPLFGSWLFQFLMSSPQIPDFLLSPPPSLFLSQARFSHFLLTSSPEKQKQKQKPFIQPGKYLFSFKYEAPRLLTETSIFYPSP